MLALPVSSEVPYGSIVDTVTVDCYQTDPAPRTSTDLLKFNLVSLIHNKSV